MPAVPLVSTTAYLFDAIGVKTSPVVAERDVVDNVDVVTVLWCIRTATADNNTTQYARAPLSHTKTPVPPGGAAVGVWVVSGDFDMTAKSRRYCGEIDVLASARRCGHSRTACPTCAIDSTSNPVAGGSNG